MISIILPTYNEKGNILKLIKAIEKTFAKENIYFEIIIVDDSSPDKTADTVRKNILLNNVKVFERKGVRGLATAILYGIKKAKGNIIVGIDADFNHPPEKIIDLVNKLNEHDMVIGSRFIKGGGMEDRRRYYLTYIFNLFLKYILGFPTMDNMSGFYAIKRQELLRLPIKKIYQGYGEYHLRLVHFAQKHGLKIIEIPIYYKKRRYGKSKSKLLKLFFQYILVAFELKLKG